VFELWPHPARAEIELGTDAGVAQSHDHSLVISDAVLVEHRNDHWPRLGVGRDLPEMLERRHEARHTDRESARGHRLTTKARYESVVASATTHGAETCWLTMLVFGL